jgi:hypothetical protein
LRDAGRQEWKILSFLGAWFSGTVLVANWVALRSDPA